MACSCCVPSRPPRRPMHGPITWMTGTRLDSSPPPLRALAQLSLQGQPRSQAPHGAARGSRASTKLDHQTDLFSATDRSFFTWMDGPCDRYRSLLSSNLIVALVSAPRTEPTPALPCPARLFSISGPIGSGSVSTGLWFGPWTGARENDTPEGPIQVLVSIPLR